MAIVKDYTKGEFGIEPTSYGWGVFKNGKMLGEFDSEEDALEFIKFDNLSLNTENEILIHTYEVRFINDRDESSMTPIEAPNKQVAFMVAKKLPFVKKIVTVELSANDNPHYEKIYDSIKNTLNPKIWTEEKTLKPEIKKQVEKVVEKFENWLDDVDVEINIKDVIIIGSNASYNYDNASDLDIHIIVDCDNDTMMKVYEAYKTLFNEVYDVEFKDIDVEIYVENSLEELASKGIYSINTGWIKEPRKEEVEEKDVSSQLKEYVDEFNRIINKKSPSVTEIDNLINKMYELRKPEGKFSGEFSEGNLIFKEFRRKGYLEKLKNLKTIMESKELSLEDSEMDKKLIEMLVANGSCATKKEAIERVKRMSEEDKKKLRESINKQTKLSLYEDADVTKERLKELLDEGFDIYLGWNNEDAGSANVGNGVYASTEYSVIKDKDKYVLYTGYTDDDGEWYEGEEEKFDSFEDLHDRISKIKFVEKDVSVNDENTFSGKFPHLEKVFSDLNKKEVFEDEEFDSMFDFDYRIEDGNLKIYDKNEMYSINYEDEVNSANEELEWEFGYKMQPYTDTIFPRIEEALKQDGFGDEVLEWENNVIMTIHIPEKLVKDNCFKDSKIYNKGDKVMFNGKEYTVDTISDSDDVKKGLQNVTLINKDGKKVEAKMFQLKDVFVEDDDKKLAFFKRWNVSNAGIIEFTTNKAKTNKLFEQAKQLGLALQEMPTPPHWDISRYKISNKDNSIYDSSDDIDVIDRLITDEYEAVDAYQKAMTETSDVKEKQTFAHILSEELAHIEELKALKQNFELPIVDAKEVPWIMQQGEDGEPEFIGWAKSHNEILESCDPDIIHENTYISELDDKDVYLGLKDDLDEEDIKKLDEYFKVKIKDINPRKGESKEDFISRFMKETKEEYPNYKQRLAVAYSYWNRK